MKYLFIQLFLFFLSVFFLYYFASQQYFLPESTTGVLGWQNIVIFVLIVFASLEGIIASLVFFTQKILFFRTSSEWPSVTSSLKWSLIIPFLVSVVFILNIFHILTLGWGIAVAIIVIAVILLLK